jgi:pimeloyl-ACP methyl ester carboxylesterase
MQPDELTALGDLAGDAVAGAAGQVRGVHESIARRIWRTLGPIGVPSRVVHDLVVGSAYTAAQGTLGTGIRGGALMLSAAIPADSPSLHESGAARVAIGVLNGAAGDTLERRENALALKMALRSRCADVEPTPDALSAAYPAATGKLAVFVHGLGETEDAWWLAQERHQPYGARLSAELGYTPLYVRYNSGRSVSESGYDLAALLLQVSSAWPVEIHEIALIGHAMGGLVARSACDQGAPAMWSEKVAHVITLGSPERGAPLEWLANGISSAMARLPETRALAGTLSRRSAGLKELRSGGRDIPFAAHIKHAFLDYRRLGPLRHFKLLNEPAVYEQIRARLEASPQLPEPR